MDEETGDDNVILRLAVALFEIREGCAFAIRLPSSGKALGYEDIAKIAAEAMNWKPGMSLEDTIHAALDEAERGQG